MFSSKNFKNDKISKWHPTPRNWYNDKITKWENAKMPKQHNDKMTSYGLTK